MPLVSTFAGLTVAGVGFGFTRSLGISPDVNTIPLAVDPGDKLPESGDLVISHDTGQVVVRELYCDGYHYDPFDGVYWVSLRDRRWKWPRRSYVTGRWNRRSEDGKANNQRSIRQLALVCLAEMGEVGFDLGPLPNDIYPEVNWEFAAAGPELESLCSMVDCAVALGLDGNVKVVKIGQGGALPAFDLIRQSSGRQRRFLPGTWIVRGARIVKEILCNNLEPVGEELDGSVKALTNLSYKPADGFKDAFLGNLPTAVNYNGVDYDEDEIWEKASRSVYKWYRLPEAQQWRLPILSERVTTKTTPEGEVIRLGPMVTVTMLDATGPPPHRRVTVQTHEGFSLDARRGIVMFADVAVSSENDEELVIDDISQAAVNLTFAFESIQQDGSIKDEDFYMLVDGVGGEIEVIHAPELVLYRIHDVDQNVAALDDYATKLIDQRSEQADILHSERPEFLGIRAIDLDGQVRAVTWSIGVGNVSTSVEWNTEAGLGYLPQYEEKLFNTQQRSLTASAAARAKSDEAQVRLDAGGRAGVCSSPAPALSGGFVGGGWVKCVNTYGAIPAKAFVMVAGLNDGRQRLECTRPDAAGIGAPGITLHASALNQLVTVCIQQVAAVSMDSTGSVAAGDKVATDKDSFLAVKSTSGSHIVRAVIDSTNILAEPAGGGSNGGMVKVTSKTYTEGTPWTLALQTKLIDFDGNDLDAAGVDTYVFGDVPPGETDGLIALTANMKVGDIYWAYEVPPAKRIIILQAPTAVGMALSSIDVGPPIVYTYKYVDAQTGAAVGVGRGNIPWITHPAGDPGPFIQKAPGENDPVTVIRRAQLAEGS